MTPTIETVLEQAHLLPMQEKQKLLEMLSRELTPLQKAKGNANGKERHFQETATAEEWSEALHYLANEPRIEAPDIPDEAFRRENLYTREDKML